MEEKRHGRCFMQVTGYENNTKRGNEDAETGHLDWIRKNKKKTTPNPVRISQV